MLYILMFFLVANSYTFQRYFDFINKEISYKQQQIIDVIGPFGAILARKAFGFSLEENKEGYLLGIPINIFIYIILLMY